MTRLSEIMTQRVEAVTASATLRELAEFFVDQDVSGAPVLSGDEVVGVVSVTDLIEFDVEERGAPVYEAVEAGGSGDDRRWRPDEADGPSAYYSQPWEEAVATVRTRLETSDPLWSSLEEHTVEEIMTRELLTLPADTDVREAARSMVASDVHRLLVMDAGRLAGLVTTTDIVKAVADRGLGA